MEWLKEEGISAPLQKEIEVFRAQYAQEQLPADRAKVETPRFHYYGTEVMEKAVRIYTPDFPPAHSFL